MTGRDLILYILTNNLEDEPVVKDGKIIGFLTAEETAARLNVGTASVFALIAQGNLNSVQIEESILIPARCPLKSGGNDA